MADTATTETKEKASAKTQASESSVVHDSGQELDFGKEGKYVEATGRRKTSVARVRLQSKGEKGVFVNGKPAEEYFQTEELRRVVSSPFDLMRIKGSFHVASLVKGGGVHSQAEAIRHGISRALVRMNADFRKRLKKAGFLTRDPRMRERKKFGLKRARRAPQWKKR